jgi:hypothetical protein
MGNYAIYMSKFLCVFMFGCFFLFFCFCFFCFFVFFFVFLFFFYKKSSLWSVETIFWKNVFEQIWKQFNEYFIKKILAVTFTISDFFYNLVFSCVCYKNFFFKQEKKVFKKKKRKWGCKNSWMFGMVGS